VQGASIGHVTVSRVQAAILAVLSGLDSYHAVSTHEVLGQVRARVPDSGMCDEEIVALIVAAATGQARIVEFDHRAQAA
jgi:hypothetical protein